MIALCRNKTRCSKRKAKPANGGSGRESVGSHDTGIYLNPDDIDSPLAVPHLCSPTGRYVVPNPASHVDNVDGTNKPNDVRCNHRRSSLSRRTSIEKTSAWLQQQSPKQLDSNTNDLKNCDASTNQFLNGSDDDKHREVVSSSHSEPLVASQTLESPHGYLKFTRKTSDIADLMQCSRSEEFCGTVMSSSSNICSKPRQLRFSCSVADSDKCWPSETVVGHADSLENNLVDCRSKYEDATDLNMSENMRESSCGVTAHGCSASSSMNDIEDGSPQDDAVSIANSNTSISDTCNSSLKSSTEDLVRIR